MPNKQQASELWHGTLALSLSQWVYGLSKKEQVSTVILSGGCFQNKVLLEQLQQFLKQLNMTVFISQQVPVNDGGVSLGQAWLVSKYLQKEQTVCV